MTDGPSTPTELVMWAIDNGASAAFVAVLATDAPHGGRHHARAKTARQARQGDVSGVPPWGGHLTALWRGDVWRAWRTADGARRRTMRAAGAVPADARGDVTESEVVKA